MKTHIYAQQDSHGEAYLVGDTESLKSLRDAIDRALAKDSSSFETSSEDGEGYNVLIVKLEENDPKWDDLLLPYPHATFGQHPFVLLGRERYRKLMGAE